MLEAGKLVFEKLYVPDHVEQLILQMTVWLFVMHFEHLLFV